MRVIAGREHPEKEMPEGVAEVYAPAQINVLLSQQPVIQAECRLDAGFAQTIERRHQVLEAVIFERAVMHAVMAYFLRIVRQTGDGKKGNAVIGVVVGGPCGDLIPELDLSADDSTIPGEHLIKTAGFDGHMVQLLGLIIVSSSARYLWAMSRRWVTPHSAGFAKNFVRRYSRPSTMRKSRTAPSPSACNASA